jgi:hypothetical protein
MAMYKYLFLLTLSSLFAQMPPMDFADNKKIAVQNTILAKVNETTFSVMDVKKKMDLLFRQNYAHLDHSAQARFQFYEMGWRATLMQMVDHELILSDAAAREIKLSDGEVREELEARFGPNVLSTLDKIDITYDEAWKMVKNDLIVQRMSWWFIQSKAMQSVTPHDIRAAYQAYLQENPPYQQLKYQVITLRSEESAPLAEKVHRLVSEKNQNPEELALQLKEIDPSLQISAEYTVSDKELSEAHRTALSNLSPKTYSLPILQKSRTDHKVVARIFYLKERTDYPAPSFGDLSAKLKNDLLQKAIAKESSSYIDKLRKHYGFDLEHIKESFPEDMHPFSLQ